MDHIAGCAPVHALLSSSVPLALRIKWLSWKQDTPDQITRISKMLTNTILPSVHTTYSCTRSKEEHNQIRGSRQSSRLQLETMQGHFPRKVYIRKVYIRPITHTSTVFCQSYLTGKKKNILDMFFVGIQWIQYQRLSCMSFYQKEESSSL